MNRHPVKTMTELGSQNFYQFPDRCPEHGEERNRGSKSYGCDCHYEEVESTLYDRQWYLLRGVEVLRDGEIWCVNEWSPWKDDKARTIIKKGEVVETVSDAQKRRAFHPIDNPEGDHTWDRKRGYTGGVDSWQ